MMGDASFDSSNHMEDVIELASFIKSAWSTDSEQKNNTRAFSQRLADTYHWLVHDIDASADKLGTM